MCSHVLSDRRHVRRARELPWSNSALLLPTRLHRHVDPLFWFNIMTPLSMITGLAVSLLVCRSPAPAFAQECTTTTETGYDFEVKHNVHVCTIYTIN